MPSFAPPGPSQLWQPTGSYCDRLHEEIGLVDRAGHARHGDVRPRIRRAHAAADDAVDALHEDLRVHRDVADVPAAGFGHADAVGERRLMRRFADTIASVRRSSASSNITLSL